MYIDGASILDFVHWVADWPTWLKILGTGLVVAPLLALRILVRELRVQAWLWEYRNAGGVGACSGWIGLSALAGIAGLVYAAWHLWSLR